jgi:hypothetical protein
MRFLKRQTINRRQLKSTTVYSDITDANVYINPRNSGSMVLPSGTDAQIPATPINGMMRYNVDHNEVQVYQGSKWRSLKFKEASPIIQQNLGAGDGKGTYFGPLNAAYNPTNTSSNFSGSGPSNGEYGGQNILVVVENVLQLYNTNYTIEQNPTITGDAFTGITSANASVSATTIYFNTSLTVTAATGNGSTSTLSFSTQAGNPFSVGQTIIVSGVTPNSYNGNYTVTAVSTSSVSYSCTAVDPLVFAGTVSSPSAIYPVVPETALVGSVVTGHSSLQSNTLITSYSTDTTTGALLSIVIDKPLITATLPAGTTLTLTESVSSGSGYYLAFTSPVPYNKTVTALIGFDQ